jgi:hypothetical protein
LARDLRTKFCGRGPGRAVRNKRIAFVANAGICAIFWAITNQYVHVSFQLAERPILQLVNDAVILCLYLAFMAPFVRLAGLPGAAAAALASELCGLAFGLWLKNGFRSIY